MCQFNDKKDSRVYMYSQLLAMFVDLAVETEETDQFNGEAD